MNRLALYITSLVLITLFTGCKKMVLGEPESNDPENNFEIFWKDFDENYALFGVRDWDWDSIYTVYRPQVTPGTTDDELWTILKEMVEYLDDSHTLIYNTEKQEGFVSGSVLSDIAEEEFDFDLVQSKFTENMTALVELEDIKFHYGKIKEKNIGYIYLNSMDGYEAELIDQVIEDLSQYEAIIFDIRNNGGGDDEVGARIAGTFTDKKDLVYTIEEKNGPGHHDFDEKIMIYGQPEGSKQYLKPVIMLTDRYTVSAAETFLMRMNPLDHVTQIGDTTSGDFSDVGMLRFLPNGWVYQYSIMQYLLPDGTSLDGIGHLPDVYVKNTKADVAAGQDHVMDKAINYLFTEYGIE